MTMTPKAKQRVAVVLNVAKVVFHWGFMPAVLYLGESLRLCSIFFTFLLNY